MRKDKTIVLLTGAGISAESGIKTFRDHGGLWENYDIMEVASPEGFSRNPELVLKFYAQRFEALNEPDVRPNPAHFALAKLQNEFAGKVILITQNVDNLHERAGSTDIIHMHGELTKMRCQNTGSIFEMSAELSVDSLCQCCQRPGQLRPHIVWFGEVPFYMDFIEQALSEADMFIAIGTSGQVYPAAMFVEIAKLNRRCKTIEINLDPAENSRAFDEHHHGSASAIVPRIVESCLDGTLFHPKNNRS
jgi:NAD-dependent deacetylase